LQATQSMVYGYTLPKKLIWSYWTSPKGTQAKKVNVH
jgi:hypothetical protein